MKRFFLILVILTSVVILIAEPLDKIVAKVGRKIILQSELNKRVLQLKATGIPEEELDVYQVLNDMIESKLILEEAKEQGFEVDPLEMKEAAENQITKVSSQFDSQAEFKKALKNEMGLTIPELRDYYLDMIKEQSLQEQIIHAQIRTKVNVTDIEVEDYFDENIDDIPLRPEMIEVGLILRNIKPSEATRNDCLETINRVMDRLNDGEDFNEVLTSETECTGGNLGFIERGMMVKEFEKAAYRLQPGEYSPVVETTFGYHIVKLNERKGNQIDVSHILRVVEATEIDVKSNVQLMESVLEQLNSGSDFKELSSKYSEEDESAFKYGVLGEFTEDKYPPEYAEDLTKLEVGEHSQLIRNGEQIIILAKLQKIPERVFTFDEVYDGLKSMVLGQKEQDLYETWTKKLVKKYYVEVLLD